MHTAHLPRPAPSAWQRVLRWITVLALVTSATGCASLPANDNRTPSKAFNAPEQTPLGQLASARRAQAGARSDSGFKILSEVDIALTSRLALIEGATRTLDIQYYAIHADASTELLLRRLRAAAQRGVRVRILLDDFNSVGVNAQVLRLAFEPNVQMRLFNPLPGTRDNMIGRLLVSLHDIPRIQKRMHNKVFIADNAWGITGGRNLGDAYFGGGDKQNFVDLDVLAAGRVVRDMSASFDRYWNDELAYPVEKLMDPEDLDKWRKPEPPQQERAQPIPVVNAPAAQVLPIANAPGVLPQVTPAEVAQAVRPPLDLRRVDLVWAPAVLLVDQPAKVAPGDEEVDAGETVIDGLLHLMEQARSDVLIVSPYFVPGRRMMAVYEQMRRKGVRLRVLTNSMASNDAPAAHAGYMRYRDELLAMGVELYEMHSDPAVAGNFSGSGGGSGGRFGFGSGPGGSKMGSKSRASLHSKAVVIDGRMAVIGSMNLDLRSQIQNSEVALVIRSPALARQATQHVESTLANGAYRLLRRDGKLFWNAPPGAPFQDATSDPGASAKLKLFVRMIGPFAPDEML